MYLSIIEIFKNIYNFSLSPSLSSSLSPSGSLSVSFSVFICLSLSSSVSLCFPPSLSVFPSLFLFLSVFLSLSPSFFWISLLKFKRALLNIMNYMFLAKHSIINRDLEIYGEKKFVLI